MKIDSLLSVSFGFDPLSLIEVHYILRACNIENITFI